MFLVGPDELAPGLIHWPGRLDRAAQKSLATEIREIVKQAPLFVPRMPKTGQPFSVRMSNCGPLGWVADESGYRYQPNHPATGLPWPAIPAGLLALWHEHALVPQRPQACLINHYEPTARMGLHQDKDEADFSAPVLSVSLGDDCLFRFGGTRRRDPTRSIRLRSGDLLLIGGASRLCFHGVDRIYSGTSDLLNQPGRINLTLRHVGNA
jgi:DNA oxidative demethylase